MGVQRDVLTLANILAKVATGDERELMAVAESKLIEAGHRTLLWSNPPRFGCWSGYRTVIHLRCIHYESEGVYALAPPQPSQNVIDLIEKAIQWAARTRIARELHVRTCGSEKRR